MAEIAHYKEMHPLPFRITHWINLIAMILLVLSGIEIHYPVVAGLMGVARGTHIFCGIVLVINCVMRIILAFFVKSSPIGGTRETVTDFWNWLPQKYNRHQFGAWIKYYLFIKKDHPLSAKLGVPQKLSYLFIAVCILFMGYTGFCLWDVTMDIPFFAGFTVLVGGPMKIRIIHYFMMYFFICFTMIHGYLALIDGMALPRLMFLGKETGGMTQDPETWNFNGYDMIDENPEKIELVPHEDEEEEGATA
ncbi:MAG: cytochrome b/b6 domain-containing protein [Coriobacteriales bacterium]|jgi:Ni/Fe-hydrogenase 1 B-type cytochrome subunit